MKLQQLNHNFQSWIYQTSKTMNGIASVILFSMMLLTISDVFSRKVFGRSILGTVEISQFMMVILIFFSLAQAEILNRHVKVDLIMSRFSQRVQRVVDMITQFVCFLLFGAMTWFTLVYASNMRAVKEVSLDLLIPKYPFVYAVAVGCALLALVLLTKFIKRGW